MLDSSAGPGETQELAFCGRLDGEDQQGCSLLRRSRTPTALIRCAPHQVRPLVEEMGTFVPTDRQAMRDLEELKARSTTQYRDEVKRSGVN